MRPDYGLRLLRDGWNPHAAHHFYGLPVDGFEALGRDRYTLAAEKMHDGEVHFISFDFGPDVLETILSTLPTHVERGVREALISKPDGMKSFRFEPVRFEHVSATLGRLQQSGDETFVPFLVKELDVGCRDQR